MKSSNILFYEKTKDRYYPHSNPRSTASKSRLLPLGHNAMLLVCFNSIILLHNKEVKVTWLAWGVSGCHCRSCVWRGSGWSTAALPGESPHPPGRASRGSLLFLYPLPHHTHSQQHTCRRGVSCTQSSSHPSAAVIQQALLPCNTMLHHKNKNEKKTTEGEMFLHTTDGTVFWTIACLREELAVNRIGTRPGLCLDSCTTKMVRIKFYFCILVGVSKVLTGPDPGLDI